MASNLVIVESAAKARTIEKFLGPGYVVLASLGHVRDLPESKLGGAHLIVRQVKKVVDDFSGRTVPVAARKR